jgi:hypothetical protein
VAAASARRALLRLVKAVVLDEGKKGTRVME